MSQVFRSDEPLVAIMTTSMPEGSLHLLCLKYSLNLLFTRLRAQEFPTFLLTVSPSRVAPSPLRHHRTTKWGALSLRPSAMTFRKSPDRRIRSALCRFLPLLLDSKPLAAFGSSSLQDKASIFGAHANSKTMSSFSRQIARLKCPFHCSITNLKTYF